MKLEEELLDSIYGSSYIFIGFRDHLTQAVPDRLRRKSQVCAVRFFSFVLLWFWSLACHCGR